VRSSSELGGRAWGSAIWACWIVAVLIACTRDDVSDESSREGCGDPGSHSELIGENSCACEPGYSWCDEVPDAFECCPSEAETGGDGASLVPDEPCDETLAEQLLCVPDLSGDPSDPSDAVTWACNGERWVEIASYSTFACLAEGFEFAYGCLPGPTFLCGFGPGSPCDAEGYAGLCVDEDIIDTCVWGRRTVDRCSRLCAELDAFGPDFTAGACELSVDMQAATCVCL
jgi:hypothetical protein